MQVPNPRKFHPQGGVALPRVPPVLSPMSPNSVPGTPARKGILGACRLMCESELGVIRITKLLLQAIAWAVYCHV